MRMGSHEDRVSFRLVMVAGLLSIAAGCASHPTQPPETSIGRFDAFWTTFDREYSYFEYKRINWDSLRTVFRPRAAAAGSSSELVAVLKEMVAPLRDIHVKFTSPSGTQQPTYVPNVVVNWDRTVWQHLMGDCHLVQVRPNLGYCTMSGVAYVMVGSWDDAHFSAADLDAIVDHFRDSPAMIIDVRPNSGGSDALAFALAGRFATQSTVLGYFRFRNGPRHDDFSEETVRRISPRGTFQFTRPVLVLSGRGVYSSSESFISAMRELPNVRIVGDTTGGGTGNPRQHDLGGGWKYSVSRWIEWTADRRVIEWNGIPPDTTVPWDLDAVRSGHDPVLEAALAMVSAPSGVTHRLQRVDRFLEEHRGR